MGLHIVAYREQPPTQGKLVTEQHEDEFLNHWRSGRALKFSYNYFVGVRESLASAFRVNLCEMEGYIRVPSRHREVPGDMPVRWDSMLSDPVAPLIPLLRHGITDCDIQSEDINAEMAHLIRRVVALWPDGVHKDLSVQMADLLDYANVPGGYVEFC